MSDNQFDTDRQMPLTNAVLAGSAGQVSIAAAATDSAGTKSQSASPSKLEAPRPPRLQFALNITLTLGEVYWMRPSNVGSTRGAVYVTGGTVEGPEIRGVIVPQSGADWPLQRPDGVLDFDARYLLRTDDDVTIYVQNRGYRWGPAQVMAALSRHEEVDPTSYYMRTCPKFDVPEGRYGWMSKHVFVGVAKKTPTGNSIDYFMIM